MEENIRKEYVCCHEHETVHHFGRQRPERGVRQRQVDCAIT